jgi:hypothetical protein
MGSFDENNYGGEFTEHERTQLRVLHQRLDDKFDEIAAFLVKSLGYDKADPRARKEASEAVERWEEEAEMADNPVRPTGPLQHLLDAHHSISEEIMDIRDRIWPRQRASGPHGG